MPKHWKGTTHRHTVVTQGLQGRRAPDIYAVGPEADWMEDGALLRTELTEEDFG